MRPPTTRTAILAHLEKTRIPQTPKTITTALKLPQGSVSAVLRRLLREGTVTEDVSKRYAINLIRPRNEALSVQVTLPEIFGNRLNAVVAAHRKYARQREKSLNNIMQIIISGTHSPSKIAEVLKLKRTTAAYYLKRMKENRIIRLQTRGRTAVYEVTAYGKALLIQSILTEAAAPANNILQTLIELRALVKTLDTQIASLPMRGERQ